MKIHHLNCATFCPPLFGSRMNRLGKLICHCLLVESSDGLVLIDTGLGTKLLREPAGRCPPGALKMLGACLHPEETALHQIVKLGFAQKDVRHIIVTHLDFDHAGGLDDFPEARVHVYEDEYQAAMRRATFFEKQRYCPAQWEHDPRWQRYPEAGDNWHGFQSVRALIGDRDDILLVPVTGHSRGHCAIAVKSQSGYLLHCGDAYFHKDEMDSAGRRCPTALDLFQRVAQFDGPSRMKNQERLRLLAAAHAAPGPEQVRLFSAHDPEEFAGFAAGSQS